MIVLTIITLVIFFVFIAIAAVLILLERKFIQQRKKGEWILPIIITIMAIALIVSTGGGTKSTNRYTDVIIWDNHVMVGNLGIIKEKGECALAVGFLKLDNGKGYIEVNLQGGELIGSKEALPYRKAIIKSAGDLLKGFTGTSRSYEELQDLSQKREKLPLNLKDGWTWYSILWRSILPIILWIMLFFSSWRRKKRNQLDKTKLEDL